MILKGASFICVVVLLFRRSSGRLPSVSFDLPLAEVLQMVSGKMPTKKMPVTPPRTYDLDDVDGVPLAVTDAVALGGGRVLLSAAAEDTDDPVEDGPVVGSAMVLLHDDEVVAVAELPATGGRVHKVEGLALLDDGPGGAVLLAVVDDDDPDAPSTALRLRVER
jgi:hypothetical protein